MTLLHTFGSCNGCFPPLYHMLSRESNDKTIGNVLCVNQNTGPVFSFYVNRNILVGAFVITCNVSAAVNCSNGRLFAHVYLFVTVAVRCSVFGVWWACNEGKTRIFPIVKCRWE